MKKNKSDKKAKSPKRAEEKEIPEIEKDPDSYNPQHVGDQR